MEVLARYKVPISLVLNTSQREDAYRLTNLHYLGDAEANIVDDETGKLVAKYPDKETPEHLASHHAICRTYNQTVEVLLLSTGELVLASTVK